MSSYCNGCNYWFDGGFCNRCYQPSCSSSCTPNTNYCGCLNQTEGNCVFYNSATTSCLGIAKGTNYDTIIGLIDAKLCTIGNSGVQTIYNVAGTTDQIDVATTTSGRTTTYTVSLDPVFTNTISDIQTSIAGLQSCCSASINSITTNTPSYLNISNQGSGVWRINYTPPTSSSGGIVQNDFPQISVSPGATVNVFQQVLNFSTLANIATKDVIEFSFNAEVGSNDVLDISFINSATNTLVYLAGFQITPISSGASLSGKIKFNLQDVTSPSAASAIVSAVYTKSSTPLETSPLAVRMGNAANVSAVTTSIGAVVTNIDLTGLKIVATMVNNSGTIYCHFSDFTTEVKKFI